MPEETGQETTSFDAGTMIGEDGNFNDAGRGFLKTSLGEGFEDYKGLDDYNNVAAIAKGLAETKKAYSTKQEGMVKLLTADSTAEEITAYREAKGVPAAYEITRRKDSEGKDMEFDEVGTKMINDWMQSKNYSQSEAQDLMTMYDEYEESMITRMAEDQVADKKAADEAFDQKHGTEAEKVRRLAGEAITKLNFAPVVEQLEKAYPGIGNNPAILDWFHGEIIPKMLPGQFKEGESTDPNKGKGGLSSLYTHDDSKKLKTAGA